MTRHLLVSNDFPPKVGGIQAYLWELWRRLPPDSFVVYTTPHKDSARFDAAQPFQIIRSVEPVLLPNPALRSRINSLAATVAADFVVIDPAVPLGMIGPALDLSYAVVLHGSEVTVPGRLPVSRSLLKRVLINADLVIAAGGYPAAEAERAAGRPLRSIVVPPGVDGDRFRPLSDAEKHSTRVELGLSAEAEVVLGLSRLVPRKGFDDVIRAVGRLGPFRPNLVCLIAGAGRDRRRLERLAQRVGAPVRFLGRVEDELVPRLYGIADVFAMMCRVRWFGLEQEGFGIVFVEAAAAGTAQIAGASGGAHEAVAHAATGIVVERPSDVATLAANLTALLDDPTRLGRMGEASRQRAIAEFDYDSLAQRLSEALDEMGARCRAG
ncbi:MAG: glycosyltransferase family 4 protein [Acidimicrobiales bacterium]